MPAIKVTLNIEVDGEPIRGFPLIRRFEADNRQSAEFSIGSGAAFVAAPIGEIGNAKFLVFQPLTQPMNIRVNGDVGSEFTLAKGGFVVIVDASGFTGTTVQNNSGSTALAQIIAAGT